MATIAELKLKASDLRSAVKELTSQRDMLTKKIGFEYAYDKVRLEAVKEEINIELNDVWQELCCVHHMILQMEKL